MRPMIAAVPLLSQASADGKLKWLYALSEGYSWTLDSPVMTLIQSVYQQFPKDGLRILRQHLHLSFDPNEAERAVIKTAAKRWKPLSNLIIEEVLANGRRLSPALDSGSATKMKSDSTKTVFCTILSPDSSGRLQEMAWGTNRAWQDRTAHAEISALRDYRSRYDQPFPEGTKVLVDLKPCRMCAACLTEFAGPGVQVLYRFPDGPASLATALDRGECLSLLEPDSPDIEVLEGLSSRIAHTSETRPRSPQS